MTSRGAGQRFGAQRHRQRHLDAIAIPPLAIDRDVAIRGGAARSSGAR